jgi:predicted acyltransferase (DUF342 family)
MNRIFKIGIIILLIEYQYSFAQGYKKKTQAQATKPSINLEELGAINFLLENNGSVEVKGIENQSQNTIISGKNHTLDGFITAGGKPALRLNVSESIPEVQYVTLEGVGSPIEGNINYSLNTSLLFSFLRDNADYTIEENTTWENQTIGSENDYKIVYVKNAQLTLGNNFTGYGILYIEDGSDSDQPALQMIGNARWNGLIILNQTNTQKTSKIYLNGSAPQIKLEDFILLGIENVIIGNNLQVASGNVGVTSQNGSIAVGNNADFSGSLLANTIILGNNCKVGGDIHYNNFLHGHHFNLGGTAITPLSFPFLELPSFPSFDAGTQKIIKGNNQTFYLEPGSYDKISFGNNCTLYLNGGEYRIKKLIMGNNCKIKYLASSTLMIKNRIIMGNNPRVEPGVEGLDADKCIFYIEGHGCPLLNVFVVGNNPKLYCNVYAPNSTIIVGNNAQYRGAFIAKRILTGNNASAQLSLKSAFSSASQEVKIYGSMLFVGKNIQIPSQGSHAKVYYCEEALQNVLEEINSRPYNWQRWREIE